MAFSKKDIPIYVPLEKCDSPFSQVSFLGDPTDVWKKFKIVGTEAGTVNILASFFDVLGEQTVFTKDFRFITTPNVKKFEKQIENGSLRIIDASGEEHFEWPYGETRVLSDGVSFVFGQDASIVDGFSALGKTGGSHHSLILVTSNRNDDRDLFDIKDIGELIVFDQVRVLPQTNIATLFTKSLETKLHSTKDDNAAIKGGYLSKVYGTATQRNRYIELFNQRKNQS